MSEMREELNRKIGVVFFIALVNFIINIVTMAVVLEQLKP